MGNPLAFSLPRALGRAGLPEVGGGCGATSSRFYIQAPSHQRAVERRWLWERPEAGGLLGVALLL